MTSYRADKVKFTDRQTEGWTDGQTDRRRQQYLFSLKGHRVKKSFYLQPVADFVSLFILLCCQWSQDWSKSGEITLPGLYSLKSRRLTGEYRNPHYKPKKVCRPSQVYNGIPIPIRRCHLSICIVDKPFHYIYIKGQRNWDFM